MPQRSFSERLSSLFSRHHTSEPATDGAPSGHPQAFKRSGGSATFSLGHLSKKVWPPKDRGTNVCKFLLQLSAVTPMPFIQVPVHEAHEADQLTSGIQKGQKSKTVSLAPEPGVGNTGSSKPEGSAKIPAHKPQAPAVQQQPQTQGHGAGLPKRSRPQQASSDPESDRALHPAGAAGASAGPVEAVSGKHAVAGQRAGAPSSAAVGVDASSKHAAAAYSLPPSSAAQPAVAVHQAGRHLEAPESAATEGQAPAAGQLQTSKSGSFISGWFGRRGQATPSAGSATELVTQPGKSVLPDCGCCGQAASHACACAGANSTSG